MFRGPNRLISLDLSFEARFPKCSGKQKEMAAQALKKSGRGPLVPRHLRLARSVFTDGDQRAQLYPWNQTCHTSYWPGPNRLWQSLQAIVPQVQAYVLDFQWWSVARIKLLLE